MDDAATAPPTNPQSRRWLAVPHVVIPAVPLAATFALPRLGTPETSVGHRLPELVVCSLLIAAALVVRRRRPVEAALVCSSVSAAAMLVVGSPTALVLSVFFALFAAAALRPVRTAVLLWAVCSALQVVGEIATGGWDQRVMAPLALTAASAAVGVAVRQQRRALDSAREKTEIAERTGEREAARRVSDERLRIARELHDVVAHHVAVMGVQAGVAGHLMQADPQQARSAIAAVRASGRTALTELGALVGLLRSAGDDGPGAPVPGLAHLPELIATLRTSGLDVRTAGGAGEMGEVIVGHGLDEMSDITAYRIVQESLTNALRHGTGSADLAVQRTHDALVIRVSNPLAGRREVSGTATSAPGRRSPGGGHGLIGMQERASLVGARICAAPTVDGRFEVLVRFARRSE